ncbi:hypothetical protein FQN50_000842 [Emmonsiellopsis sp. PD_5]|nr:hypothetical protein FQN50_000842 [Emmonsiellopsis sp. PD_5]
MAPFGTLYTVNPKKSIYMHPPSRLPLMVAALVGLELAIPEDFEWAKSNKTPEYLAKFPLGKIPSFEGTDGFLLTESRAIAEYIAHASPDSAKKAVFLGGSDDAKTRAKVLQWMFFAAEHLADALQPLVGWRLGFEKYEADRDKQGSEDLERWLKYIDGELGGKTWLLGGSGPSLADLAVVNMVMLGMLAYIDAPMMKTYPEIERWFGQFQSVPELKEFVVQIKILDARKQAPGA